MPQTKATIYTEAHSRHDQRLPSDQHEMRVQQDGTFSCRVHGCPAVNLTLTEANEHVARNQFRA